jgi:Domain of unknown function (DUF4105)
VSWERLAPAARRVGVAALVARAALALALLAVPARAADAQAAPLASGDGRTLRVSVLTIGPGSAVFERFGHNALRITDTATGSDLAYNWGMFSFAEPNFLGRFLSGDTRYWVEAFPSTWLIEAYIAADREVIEQELALTGVQRAALAAFAQRNAMPENKYYRYDYFRDNCSTRVRDALDTVLGGSLERRFTVMTTAWTYRSESVRLTTPDALAQSGIELALGPRADVPMTAWQAMFIPMRLRDHLRDVTVRGADGVPVPIVRREQVLYAAKRPPEPAERRGLTLGAWGPILGVWMLLLAPFGAVRRERTRIPAAVMAALWYALTGLVGLLIVGMWVGSAHVFWYDNLNLLLVSPLGLVAAAPTARAILRGRASTLARVAVIAILLQALLALPVALVGPQRLAGPLLLLLPAHLGLVIAYWRHTREGTPPDAAVPA